jgi:hypothetical protein
MDLLSAEVGFVGPDAIRLRSVRPRDGSAGRLRYDTRCDAGIARAGRRRSFLSLPGVRMPIDTHVRIAAWLHIVFGALAVAIVVLVGLVFGVFGAAAAVSESVQPGVVGWIVGLGAVFFGFFILLAALEIFGGILLLQGSRAGRVITIGFSILSLLNFPIGTAAGGYSLWALLREAPRPIPGNMPGY